VLIGFLEKHRSDNTGLKSQRRKAVVNVTVVHGEANGSSSKAASFLVCPPDTYSSHVVAWQRHGLLFICHVLPFRFAV